MTGYVKYFSKKKHYGIIVPDGVAVGDKERQVFFYEDMVEGELHEGDAVEYALNPNYPRLRALTVRASGKQSRYIPIDGGRKRGYGD